MKKVIAFLLSLAFPYRLPTMASFRQLPELPIAGPAAPGFIFKYKGPPGNQQADYLNSRKGG